MDLPLGLLLESLVALVVQWQILSFVPLTDFPTVPTDFLTILSTVERLVVSLRLQQQIAQPEVTLRPIRGL